MINIGKYNILTVARATDHGIYLTDGDGTDVLLPRRYVTDDMAVGSQVEVFVYTDSDDRRVATTERPYAVAGECAFLQVTDVNSVGAFLDWGLLAKNLLVPFAQQKARMFKGGVYPVYVYLDTASGRVVATAKIEKWIGNLFPDYQPGHRVKALVLEHTEIGYRVVVDNLHWGMVYENELQSPLTLGITIDACVRKVRDDGKIDLAVGPSAARRVGVLAHRIMQSLERAGGSLDLGDASTPVQIRNAFGCSKKDFKKALGQLYKEGRVKLSSTHIEKV